MLLILLKKYSSQTPVLRAPLAINDCFQGDEIKEENTKMSVQLLFNSCMTFVSIRLLKDIYIVKEIAGKCHKELVGSDRALRNVAFCTPWHFGILRLESQMDFIDLSSCWMFRGCFTCNSDSHCCFCQMGFL